jgi:hypothetical protein
VNRKISFPQYQVFFKEIFAHDCEHGLAVEAWDMVAEWVGGRPSSPLDLHFTTQVGVQYCPPDFKHSNVFFSEHQRILKIVSIPARSLINIVKT